MIRFILLAVFICLLYRITGWLLMLFRRPQKPAPSGQTNGPQTGPRVDASRAEDATFEEIKDP